MADELVLLPGDVFLTRGKGFVSKAIRFFTRSFGESRTKVNHVGLVVTRGGLRDAIGVEALSKVKRHPLFSRYGDNPKQEVAVFRPTNLTAEEVRIIVERAESHVGKAYGWGKVLAHLADWLLLGAYVFRRMARMKEYPICSWLVADAFAEAGKTFDVEPGAASPDDIWDFVTERSDVYTEVHPLGPLGGRGGSGS